MKTISETRLFFNNCKYHLIEGHETKENGKNINFVF